MHLAERELTSFLAAVTELYGPEQARLAADDWLDELTTTSNSSPSDDRRWRAVTIAAASRLAKRLNRVAQAIPTGKRATF
jgi:hypothetical protein